MENQIKTRVEELETAKIQTIANLNAIEGALSELKKLITPEKVEQILDKL